MVTAVEQIRESGSEVGITFWYFFFNLFVPFLECGTAKSAAGCQPTFGGIRSTTANSTAFSQRQNQSALQNGHSLGHIRYKVKYCYEDETIFSILACI
jgi:hypothetical protein